MNAHLALWSAALRGTGYPPNGTSTLITFDAQGIPSYSALGVGCEVFRRTTRTGTWNARGMFSLPSQHPSPTMPAAVVAWYGLTVTPSLLNKSFAEAADHLDAIAP